MLPRRSRMTAVSTFHCSTPTAAAATLAAVATCAAALWEMRQTRGSLTSHWLMSCCCSNYLPCLGAETSSRSSSEPERRGRSGPPYPPTLRPACTPPSSPPIRPSRVTPVAVLYHRLVKITPAANGVSSMRKEGNATQGYFRGVEMGGRGMKQERD